jgi:hypothetical protein
VTDPTPDAAREKKLRQIQGLLDLAADERTSEGERDAAMKRAMALMAAHGVTDMMVDARKRSQTDELIRKTIPMTDPYSREKMMLAMEIGHALHCRSTYRWVGRSVTSITLFGHRSDIERVEMLYTSLLLQAVRAVRDARPEWWATAAETRSYRKNFLVGFGRRVGTRLMLAELEAREKYDREHTNVDAGTAIVLATRDAKVERFYKDETDEIKFGRKSRAQYGGDGSREGRRAGDKAKLDGGTGVTSGDRTAIGR